MPPERKQRPLPVRIYRRITRDLVRIMGPWAIAAYMLLLKITCRVRFHNDPRSVLRAAGHSYVFSVLHAHQLAAATCGDAGTAAMVSQSRDGGAIAIGLRAVGIKPIRGSSRHKGKDKGGVAALIELIKHARSGKPAFLAVDGPRGPRNLAQKGIAMLSQKSGAPVINAVVIPRRRLIVAGSWDRLQVPLPFTRIDCYFAPPIAPQSGESIEEFCQRIEVSLNHHEALRDPAEAAVCAALRKQATAATTPPAAAA